MPKVTRTWGGDEIELRSQRAAGRAVVAIAVNAASETKRLTHRFSGTLARSTHAAPVGYEGSGDERVARGADMNDIPHATHTAEGPAVEVGSWLPYACVEWVGRGHPGVTQGVEATRGARVDAIVAAAFRAEGL